MARPTLATHPKFARLASMVGGRAMARGALELVWEIAYASGEPLVGDAAAVEFIADWNGKKGALAAAMVACRFLEETEEGLIVHDLEDHAPEYVLKRWERERARQAKGQTIRSQRQAAARASWVSRSPKEAANVLQASAVCSASVTPPAPAPAPAPKVFSLAGDPPATEQPQAGPPPPLVAPSAIHRVGAVTPTFLEVFAAYPRKDGREKAASVFQGLADQHPEGERGLADEIIAAFRSGMLKRPPYSGPNSFRPMLDTVLSELRWRDPPSAPDDAEPARAVVDRCGWHAKGGRGPAHKPRDGCPDCKEHRAARAGRAGDPTPAADALPDWARIRETTKPPSAEELRALRESDGA